MTDPIPANAVVVRDEIPDTPELRDVPTVPDKPLTTPAQAKIDAVASVTMSAYQRASQLILTAEEVDRLKADFPDEAFKPGAAGKEHLIYCEHAFLRDRLDEVLGMGQWALVPRNRWAEPFKTTQGKDGSRVYFEGMLMVRGCFVSEAIGEMEYYPHNASQNYGDACEGAESACLRRLCKKWGIGLQAWKKDWCEGWWQRKRAGKRQVPPPPVQAPAAAMAPKPNSGAKQATPAKAADVLPKEATAATRTFVLTTLRKQFGDQLIGEYFEKQSWILPTEKLEDWPLRFCPTSKPAINELIRLISVFADGGEPPQDPDSPDSPNAIWRSHVVHFGKDKGTTLADLEKPTLFGWWANYQPQPYNGKLQDADIKFREMLDMAGEHYQFSRD